ncbi:hypothetical protein [Pedobacter sp. NJ-S-72]
MLRNHSRDTLGFAIKATYVEVNGEPREIEKDPITDHKKKSLKGMLCLKKKEGNHYITKDQCRVAEEEESLLQVVYRDGKLMKETSLSAIRQLVKAQKEVLIAQL